MRTDKEIVERIKKVIASGHDWLGTEVSDLVIRLPFSEAKQFLKDEATDDEWEVCPRDREALLKEMEAYMPFAWGKANGERGISAGRSLNHFSAWVWLCGDDLGDLNDYEYYGKDNLRKICARYGWDPDQWDDGIRRN